MQAGAAEETMQYDNMATQAIEIKLHFTVRNVDCS